MKSEWPLICKNEGLHAWLLKGTVSILLCNHSPTVNGGGHAEVKMETRLLGHGNIYSGKDPPGVADSADQVTFKRKMAGSVKLMGQGR